MPVGNNSTVASRVRVCANLAWFFRRHHPLWELTSRRLRLDRCSFLSGTLPLVNRRKFFGER